MKQIYNRGNKIIQHKQNDISMYDYRVNANRSNSRKPKLQYNENHLIIIGPSYSLTI